MVFIQFFSPRATFKLKIERKFDVSRTPVVSMPNTISNGIPVGGYSIYLDSVRVHQILNPIGKSEKLAVAMVTAFDPVPHFSASTVSLSGKLLFNGAKQLTIRTLSLDGNAESKDSEPIKLVRNLINNPPPLPPPPQQTSAQPAIVQEDPRRKSRTAYPAQEPLPAPATQQLIAPVPVQPPPAQVVSQPLVQPQQPVSGVAPNAKLVQNQNKISLDSSNDLYGSNEMMSAQAPYSSPNVAKKNEPPGPKFTPAMNNSVEPPQPVPPSVVLPSQDEKVT